MQLRQVLKIFFNKVKSVWINLKSCFNFSLEIEYEKCNGETAVSNTRIGSKSILTTSEKGQNHTSIVKH